MTYSVYQSVDLRGWDRKRVDSHTIFELPFIYSSIYFKPESNDGREDLCL